MYRFNFVGFPQYNDSAAITIKFMYQIYAYEIEETVKMEIGQLIKCVNQKDLKDSFVKRNFDSTYYETSAIKILSKLKLVFKIL